MGFSKRRTIQFFFEADDLTLSEVKNAFSKRAGISKCARFEGKKAEDAFRRGYVIDGSSLCKCWTSLVLDEWLSARSTGVDECPREHFNYLILSRKCSSDATRWPNDRRSAKPSLRSARKRTEHGRSRVADKLLSNANRQRFSRSCPEEGKEDQVPNRSKVFAKQLGCMFT